MSGDSRAAAVIVVNFGSSALLATNLVASVASGSGVRARPTVVVVDNWTDQQERDEIRRLAGIHGWLVETPSTNLGFGGGMNRGAACAIAQGAQELLLLNPDARLAPEDVDRLTAAVAADRSLLVAPRIVTSEAKPWMSAIMDLRLSDGTVMSSRHRRGQETVMEWVSGAVMALSTDLWQRIGGFDEDYFLYWEDVDLCRRALEVGARVSVDPTVVAIHDEGGTHRDGGSPRAGGSTAKSEAYYFHNIRNRALFAAKWLDAADRRRWLLQTPRTAMETLLKGGRRQFLQSVGPWRGYLRGVTAAIRIGLAGPVPPAEMPAVPAEGDRGGGRRIRVLESFQQPSGLTNPYITQLRDTIRATPGLSVICWNWRDALLGSYDVFHAHWPEVLIERRGAFSTPVRRCLYGLFLLRLWITRTPVVRTVHNLELPEGLTRAEYWLLHATEQLTRERIVLNEFTPAAPGVADVLIPHGHYRDWFARYDTPAAVPGRVAFVGKIRRYKNTEALVHAFSGLAGPGYSLHISGRPSSSELAADLQAAARADSRISLALDFLDDADFVREVCSAEVVALPYQEMHNSGSVLAALSLDRPVLVPHNEFNEALSREMGEGWVMMFEGELTPEALGDALAAAQQRTADHPRLSGREWEQAGICHRAAFGQALAGRRPDSRSRLSRTRAPRAPRVREPGPAAGWATERT